MKSIKQQYIDLREGNMTQANFMRNLRMTLPHFVTNVTSFDDSVRILKNKGILTEADTNINELIFPLMEQWLEDVRDIIEDKWQNGEITQAEYGSLMTKLSTQSEDIIAQYGKINAEDAAMELLDSVSHLGNEYDPGPGEDEDFERDYDADYEEPNEPFDIAESLNESKDGSSEGKWKTVTGKDLYAQFKEIDNLNAQEVLIGLDWEMEKDPELTKAAAAKIVIKNIKKNPIYYTMTDLAGKEGAEAETMGPKSDIAARQMQYLEKNMGNIVDKKMGMQPVKDVEKPKKDSDKGGETNKMEKGISLMSLIAKSTRGVQKMDATGEKMKKITIKEGQYDFIGHLKAGEEKELRSKIPDVRIEEDTEYGQKINTTISSETKSDEEIKSIIDKIIGMPGTKKDVPSTIFNKNAGITAGLKSLTKDDLMEMIRKELDEITGAYGGDAMDPEDGSSYTNY